MQNSSLFFELASIYQLNRVVQRSNYQYGMKGKVVRFSRILSALMYIYMYKWCVCVCMGVHMKRRHEVSTTPQPRFYSSFPSIIEQNLGPD